MNAKKEAEGAKKLSNRNARIKIEKERKIVPISIITVQTISLFSNFILFSIIAKPPSITVSSSHEINHPKK
jgi:hypothetical protein